MTAARAWLEWLESAGRYWDTHRLEEERMDSAHILVAQLRQAEADRDAALAQVKLLREALLYVRQQVHQAHHAEAEPIPSCKVFTCLEATKALEATEPEAKT